MGPQQNQLTDEQYSTLYFRAKGRARQLSLAARGFSVARPISFLLSQAPRGDPTREYTREPEIKATRERSRFKRPEHQENASGRRLLSRSQWKMDSISYRKTSKRPQRLKSNGTKPRRERPGANSLIGCEQQRNICNQSLARSGSSPGRRNPKRKQGRIPLGPQSSSVRTKCEVDLGQSNLRKDVRR